MDAANLPSFRVYFLQVEAHSSAQNASLHPRRPTALRRSESQQRPLHGRRGAQEAKQEQETRQEIGKEIRRVPGFGSPHQTDPQTFGSRLEQGRQVPWSSLPSRIHDDEDRRSQSHHQVPNEEGEWPHFIKKNTYCFSENIF